jgi:hypothetical protein
MKPVHYQPQQSVLKRQAGQRQTACMRYISAPQRSHFIASSLACDGEALSADLTGVTISRTLVDRGGVFGEGESTPAL